MAANERRFTIVIAGDTKGGEQALSSMETTSSKLTGTLAKVGAAVGGVYAARKAFGFLSDSIKDAAEEGQGIEVLANTLRNTVGATDAQVKTSERWITTLQNATGVMDDKLRPALGKLLIGGRSVEQSQKDLAVALDIAAARGVDLDTVVTAMGKAAIGNTTTLSRLGVATKNAAGETLSYDQILQEASRTMGGAAAAAADTAAGRAAILNAQFADLKEKIGTGLLPVMEALTAALTRVVAWLSNLDGRTVAVIATIGSLIGTFVLAVAGLNALTAAAALFGVTLNIALGPVALAITAIAAVAAGVIYAYTHFETFRNVVNTVVAVVRDGLLFWIGVLRAEWDIAWKVIGTAVELAWKVIGPILDTMMSAIDRVLGALERIKKFGGSLFGGELTVKGPDGKTYNTRGEEVKGYAMGGWVPGPIGKPQLAVVHGGEYITPAGGGGGGGITLQMNFNGIVGDPAEVGRMAVDAIAQHEARNGPGWRS